MPVKITVRNLDSGVSNTFDLPTSPVRVGRNGLNELALEEGFVSQFHAVIRFAEDGVFFRDLGSTNGSALDGSRLPKNVDVPIKPTSDLRIGPLRLTVEYRPPSVTPLPVGSTKIPTGPHHTVAMFGMPRPGEGVPRTGAPGRVSYGPTMQPGGGSAAPQATGPGEAVKDLARRVLPAGREPTSDAEANKLVEAVAVILDAFSHSFVGLRRGVEQAGAELGVRTMTGRSTLHTTKEPRQVLSYLLEGPGKIQTRAQELVSVFADFGVHQVALLNGITESVKALLTRLDPNASGEKKAKLWPFGGGGSDKTLQTIRELLEDDRQLHAAIFGEEFAKAYAAGTLGSDAVSNKGKP